MHERLTIESMLESDIDDILAIEEVSFPGPWTRPMFEQELVDSSFSRSFVVRDAGRVLGYIVSWFLRYEVHVLNVAVAPPERGRGIGRALMQHVVDAARRGGREVVTLEVRPGNEPARKLYESMGFQIVAVRKGYYTQTGEDALVMVLSPGGEESADG